MYEFQELAPISGHFRISVISGQHQGMRCLVYALLCVISTVKMSFCAMLALIFLPSISSLFGSDAKYLSTKVLKYVLKYFFGTYVLVLKYF